MTIDNLYSRYYYPSPDQLDIPILVVMHGWSSGAASFTDEDLRRLCNYGLFVIVPGMRGRDSASGTKDASGREIYDIYDAVEKTRLLFPSVVSATKAAIVGYSGGGGNALSAACKFPDYFNVVVSHFGISDYGRSSTNGWYYNNGGAYTSSISTAIGGTPISIPNNYYARDATVGITNFTGGKLFIYHDDQDVSVPVIHSTRIKNTLDGAGLSNYSYNISSSGSNPRFSHGYPADNQDLIAVEEDWVSEIFSQPAWIIEPASTKIVLGAMETKRFSIRLKSNGSSLFGLDAVASVEYNVETYNYIITPLTSGLDVVITQDGKTGSATNISEQTEITVT